MKYKVGDRFRYKDCYETYEIVRCDEELGQYVAVEVKEVGSRIFNEWEEKNMVLEVLVDSSTKKLKLIDILNKIANGELKEGTKVIRKDVEGFVDIEYTYMDGDLEREGWNETIYIFEDIFGRNLNDEVELIEPQEPTECEHEWENYGMYNPNTGETKDFRKCAKCDLEEDIEPTDNTTEKIEELECGDKYGGITARIINKLNEVIRHINK